MTTPSKTITPELLRTWQPCSDGYKRFCELFPEGADVKTAVDGLIADNQAEWAEWLFNKARSSGVFTQETTEGFKNTGHWNTGHRNTGDQNTGHRNTGHRNTGHRNTGYWNTGDQNTGHWNTGDQNTGYRNTGDQNTGHWNTGDQNTGDQNTGYRNTGDQNTGHWNTGHRNTGYFNTVTPDTILAFNKPCSRDKWENATIPNFLYFSPTEWICVSSMTDQEKIDNPKFYVAGGYLKKIDYKAAFQKAWDKADTKDRALIKKLPNFDAKVFFEISGIEVI